MSPKDVGSDTVFLQYVADMLSEYPESSNIEDQVAFGTRRAADLLSVMGDTLAAAGESDMAELYLATAQKIESLAENSDLDTQTQSSS